MKETLNNNLKKLKEILLNKDVVKTINNNYTLMCNIIPEIQDMHDCEHKHPHHNDTVWEHTLKALSYSPIDFDIRLTLLLHHLGKVEVTGPIPVISSIKTPILWAFLYFSFICICFIILIVLPLEYKKESYHEKIV